MGTMKGYKYNGAIDRVKIKPGEKYSVNDGQGLLFQHDIFDDIPAEYYAADYVVVDPPWNRSILKDGYTQPVVTIFDDKIGKYVIIDGFHRYFVCRKYKDIYERNHGMLPVVVLKKSINDRMASTVRHNRARGKHSVNGMSNLVFKMLDNGWSDEEICNEMGMEAEELLRLKHIAGFSKLFENAEYKLAWESRNQIRLKKLHEENPDLSEKELNRLIKQDS